MFCTKCGNKLVEGAAFCGECGASINPVSSTPVNNIPVNNTPLKHGEPKKKGKALPIVLSVLAGVLLIAVIVAVVIHFATGSKNVINIKDVSNTTIVAGDYHTVAINNDKTISVAGRESAIEDIDGWDDIINLSAYSSNTAAVRSDGTVVSSDLGVLDTSVWYDVVQVSVGSQHLVGLKSDGTVLVDASDLSKGNDCGQTNITHWEDIVQVVAGQSYTAGLKTDGTVLLAGEIEDGEVTQKSISNWSDIVSIAGGEHYLLGLKKDGTVVSTASNEEGDFDVSGWTDIISVSVGSIHAVGLKADGTVVSTGYNEDLRAEVEGWTDVVAIAAGGIHSVALKEDGTFYTTGNNEFGQCDLDGWDDIMVPVKNFVELIMGLVEESEDDFESQKNPEALEASDSDFEEAEEFLCSIKCKEFDSSSVSEAFIVEELLTTEFFYDGYNYFYKEDGMTKFKEDGASKYNIYMQFEKEKITWICNNIFNTEFDEDYVSESGNSYCDGNYVYRNAGVAGDIYTYDVDMTDYEQLEDGKYKLTVEYSREFEEKEILGNFEVIAELKMIDGQRVWAIYSIKRI